MVEIQEEELRDALAEDRFHELGAKIGDLPDGEQFREAVETDLWETFAGLDNAAEESVLYQELPEKSRSIIGYVKGNDEKSVPWWLQSFKWEVTARGEELTLATKEKLEQFQNLDPKSTAVRKPVLQDDITGNEVEIKNTLDEFDDLYNALDDEITLPNDEDDSSFPSNIFKMEQHILQTTREFEAWFNDLLRLCPPANGTLTALLMVNTNIRQEAGDILPNEITERLRELGIAEERFANEDYFDPLTTIIELDGVFDQVVPSSSDYESLAPLESLFYEVWAKNARDEDEKLEEWIERVAGTREPETLETGEEAKFAEIAFQAPLRLHRERLVYTTTGVTTKFDYYSGDKKKRKEIDDILQSEGYLQE